MTTQRYISENDARRHRWNSESVGARSYQLPESASQQTLDLVRKVLELPTTPKINVRSIGIVSGQILKCVLNIDGDLIPLMFQGDGGYSTAVLPNETSLGRRCGGKDELQRVQFEGLSDRLKTCLMSHYANEQFWLKILGAIASPILITEQPSVIRRYCEKTPDEAIKWVLGKCPWGGFKPLGFDD